MKIVSLQFNFPPHHNSPEMTKTFHHIFFPRKPKGYEKGPIPIYLRITIDGQRAEISTGLRPTLNIGIVLLEG